MEKARAKGYAAAGFRNKNHSSRLYQDTCFYYTAADPAFKGNTEDKVHSSACADADKDWQMTQAGELRISEANQGAMFVRRAISRSDATKTYESYKAKRCHGWARRDSSRSIEHQKRVLHQVLQHAIVHRRRLGREEGSHSDDAAAIELVVGF